MYRILACFSVATENNFKSTCLLVYMLLHKSKQSILWFRFHFSSWLKVDEEKLVIDWMSNPLAPDAALEFLSCNYTSACVSPTCVWIVNGLQYTDMCHLITCKKVTRSEEENESDSEGESDTDELSIWNWKLSFCIFYWISLGKKNNCAVTWAVHVF